MSDPGPCGWCLGRVRTHGSLLATPAGTLPQFGLATLRPVTLMEIATCRALQRFVLTATSGRRWPTALPLLPLTHGVAPSRWFASCPGIKRLARSGRRAGRTGGGVKRCGRTRSVRWERSAECTLSNCGGGVVGCVQGRSPAFTYGWSPMPGGLRVSLERPCTGLTETETEKVALWPLADAASCGCRVMAEDQSADWPGSSGRRWRRLPSCPHDAAGN
jgi:hypothetical protein